ncbi:GATOR complex protein WDR59-like isoform X3 [Zootermopsis nevadensis]|uniref:GATOR complex protein WDR59-like isoform X3 n=1 Tax=Zootermopsis nevadensis TaxID=136037 RepID=UPI000B8EE5F9|nr:GATOR complex protein WDR59-like isoform X3 [Zootermopsis nevadensis]
MATRWSSEFVVAEHRDLQASTMAVDSSGVYALLAGRRYLAIKNLDDSSDTLHKIPRHSKYEVGAAEWNPSSINKDLCAISSNQRVEILSWQSGGNLVHTQTLRSHTRAVSDLNWHRFDPNLLASCSIDTYIHVWDIRDQRRPSLSLSAVAGATQVRWNRLSRYLLATAHDGDIKLWDQRKGTAPVQYIAAHLSKIHGLDWSPTHENQLATSSQDCTVKFFDITNPRRAESILTTSSPVWRARYTPFGEGLITVVVPQLRRGENSLLLWNIANQTAPVHTFVGHTDVVLEFEWRKRKEDTSDYELITWSKDQTLRIWRIEPFLQKLCGHERDASRSMDIQETEDATAVRTTIVVEQALTHPLQDLSLENESGMSDMSNSLILDEGTDVSLGNPPDREVNPSPTQPKTLQQEFSLINVNMPNVQMDVQMDAVRRSCTVTATRNAHVVILQVSFPPSYPYSAAPTFQFAQGTSVDNNTMAKLLKVLKQTAQQRVRKNKSCLEPCLRQLVSTLDQIALSDELDNKPFLRLHHSQPSSYLESSNIYGSFQDAYIPFPRTSGAKFCSVGILVCFGRPPFARRLSTRLESPTPRSLSALGGNLNSFNLGGSSSASTSQYSLIYPPVTQSPTGDPNVSITSFYFQDRKQPPRTRSRGVHGNSRGPQNASKTPSKKGSRAIVTIYDASSLFLIHRELGEKYVFDCHDLPGMCHRNSAIAALVGRRDLVQAWTLAALAATPSTKPIPDQDDDIPWPHHPFGKAMVESLIAYYAKQSDIQMAAMLCCTFGCRSENQDTLKNKQLSKSVNVSPGGSPYHTIHQVDLSLEGWNYPMLKQNRSNSWSDSLDDFKFISTIVEHAEVYDSESEKSVKILEEKNSHLYDTYKKAYSEILHRWNLLDARAQVLKYMTTPPEIHRGVEFYSECQYCNSKVRGAGCLVCKRLIFQCSICNLSVRGLSKFCMVCGHGGHSDHMISWFETESECPTGCGCSCTVEMASMLES